jgi:hypothetical protein
MTEPTLSPVITAHCFDDLRCNYTVSGTDPKAVHDEMEAHYAAAHSPQIARMLGAAGYTTKETQG